MGKGERWKVGEGERKVNGCLTCLVPRHASERGMTKGGMRDGTPVGNWEAEWGWIPLEEYRKGWGAGHIVG